jgi:hypothetical protein
MQDDDAPLSSVFLEFIAGFTGRPDVQSVSCPFTDEKIWRLLVAEQIQRANRSGLHLQHAFTLGGPDGGLPFDPADWGGYVHTPYEGAIEADLFIKSRARGYVLAAGMGDGASLTDVNCSKPCHHLLIHGDRRELDCASRTLVDGWTLYSSKHPYEPIKPFEHVAFKIGERSPPPIFVLD